MQKVWCPLTLLLYKSWWKRKYFSNQNKINEWIDNWRHRISQEGKEKKDIAKLINSINPSYIPRNHRIEEIIDKALEGDYSYFELLNKVLNKPYNDQNKYKKFQVPPDINQIVTQTFCGT